MPARPQYSFRQFAATRLYAEPCAYSPNGRQIAHVVNTTGQFNLWTAPTGGGMARQLTAFTDHTVRSLGWSPDGRQIVFTADQNADEFHQVYLIDAAGGWPQAITNAPQAQHHLGVQPFSPDGALLAYSANDRDPQHMEIILRERKTGATTRPFPNDGQFYAMSWSPDGRFLTAINVIGNTHVTMYLYDRLTGEVRPVGEHTIPARSEPQEWDASGSGFYFLGDAEREFMALGYWELATGHSYWIAAPPQDIEAALVSRDGKKLLWLANQDGASVLKGRDLTTGEDLDLPALPYGQVDGWALRPDGARLALVIAQPTEANNLYELNLVPRRGRARFKALGQSMLGGIPARSLIVPQRVAYPTFDGRDIPAWLYRPRGDGPFPVVLSIHGGPQAQERPRYNYNGLYQYLLHRGIGILAPNIRGSTGYGKSYTRLIERDWGGADLKDIEHAALYLHGLDWVDASRIAIFGGSFGGFAVLSAITRLPDLWAAAVDLVGPSNLVTFVSSVPPHWKPLMKAWLGDPDDDRDFLLERSPITYVDRIRTPLLVIQGANDPRVVKAESDQMVERIRARGGAVQYYVDPQEGHGATRRENAVKWMELSAEFLVEHLLKQ
ncbi:MAG: prolyl oligopeptidase family serine peptidase [Candidatus Flexifilum sp.]